MLLDRNVAHGSAEALAARRLHPALGLHQDTVKDYEPSDELVGAVNAALAIGIPLLVTGEPGTGKTQLAFYLAHYFNVKGPFRFDVRSTSEANDLLYRFDTVEYFHAANDRRRTGDLDKTRFREPGVMWQAFEESRAGRASVVLIDEIDKAPRDFPNDLLGVLDQFEFSCAPTKEVVKVGRDDPRPVVIITSNSETRLPEPFLRRCIFHHITLTREGVDRIVARRAEALGLRDPERQRAATDQFFRIRAQTGLRKKPGTAELLIWLALIATSSAWRADLRLSELPHLGALIKDHEDLARLG